MLALPQFWLEQGWPARILRPLAACFSGAVQVRAFAYRRGWLRSYRVGVSVVVVGNLFVGGSGKTPLVIWLVERLRAGGWRPGVVSRGYGGYSSGKPRLVKADDDPVHQGDEPVLIAARTGAPVAVGADRVAAAECLVRDGRCDLVISDDGLQHYRLERDAEIVVFDADRGAGNARCFPAGPLREPLSRLRRVDLVVGNGGVVDSAGYAFRLVPGRLIALGCDSPSVAPPMIGSRIRAVAGIGYPERFFRLLRTLGYRVVPQPFPDHHVFRLKDLQYAEPLPIIMTEKDAVKCRRMAVDGLWYLPVAAEPDVRTQNALDSLLSRLLPRTVDN
ncbi:tetraacyldisaccharide 4'-kinase [Nitrococcus mobilis]|uniref:Tetraacyldisaccharide 4'-kinase n=1 Tax=Nitrococcus mobilis Nb-231 TaxID=314278 RepID=A4BMK9_9GAMM|nr:tetraacyldisaccharide 4'-kinase [Nitrococcus mobilis]EAR23547.1 tetraacyldisaccharide 4'-kinase [Nitrococcus mobilis Nb-231]